LGQASYVAGSCRPPLVQKQKLMMENG